MKRLEFLLILFVSCSSTLEEDNKMPLKRKLRQCYLESDSFTGMKGNVQGEIVVDTTISPEGKVLRAEIVKSDFKDPNLLACVRGILRTTIMENKTGNTIHVLMPVPFEAVRR